MSIKTDILQSSIALVRGLPDLDYTFKKFTIENWKKWILGNNFCPKCGARVYMNCIGGYTNNPWGYWLRCEEVLFNRCDYDQYFDNPGYDESKAVYDDEGNRLG